MKHVLTFCAILALSSIVLYTQTKEPAPRDVQALPPQLEEWYSLSGQTSYVFSHIPNFKNGEGRSAIVTFSKNREGKYIIATWYNRFPMDTINQYTWDITPEDLMLLDFNGDGVRDYLTWYGSVFLGTSEDVPSKKSVIDLNFRLGRLAGSKQNNIGDFNNDGADDFYFIPYTPSEVLLNCWFGTKGASNNKVRSTQLTRLPSSNGTTEVALVMYKTNSGETRLLTADWKEDEVTKGRYYPEYNQIKLYSVQSNTSADTVTYSITLLDSAQPEEWKHPVKYGNKLPFTLGQSFLYKSKQFEEKQLYFGYSCFSLTPTAITKIQGSIFELGDPIMLDHSIDGDAIEDVVRISGYKDSTGKSIYHTGFFKGGDSILKTEFARSLYPKGWFGHSECLSIGDVTGDGIPDVAITLNHIDSGTIFKILKGANFTTAVQEISTPIATILSPNPVQSGSIIHLQSTIAGHDNYTAQLIGIDGNVTVIATDVPFASTTEQMSLQLPRVAQGSYILRLKSAKMVQDFSLIIQD